MMTAPTSVEPAAGLVDVHQAGRLGPYLAQLWDRRSYIGYVARSEVRNRQVNTVLGNIWHLLNPALNILIFYLIFGLVLKSDRGVDNFILFLTVGIFVFQNTQRAIIDGSKSIVGNLGLIKAIKFPRAILPLTSTVTETLTSLSSYVVIFAVALLTGEPFRWQWTLLFLLGALQFVFNVGAAMIAARATTHFRDLQQILPFFFRLLLYGSGVIFSVEAYASSDYAWIFDINPVYGFVELSRWCVLGGELRLDHLAITAAWSVVLLVGGMFWFKAAEERYARD